MSMQRELYPRDWAAIALEVKEAANWCCQTCGQMCRMPGESLEDFTRRMGWRFLKDKPQAYTLTVAHLDQNPHNNEPSNLKALCAPCHLNHDRPYRMFNTYAKRERLGQLKLFDTPPER